MPTATKRPTAGDFRSLTALELHRALEYARKYDKTHREDAIVAEYARRGLSVPEPPPPIGMAFRTPTEIKESS